MATKFITPNWRMPRNSNQGKASNYSLDFDGSTQFINVGTVPNFQGSTTQASVSVWFNYDTTGGYVYNIDNGLGCALIVSNTQIDVYIGNIAFRSTSVSLSSGNWNNFILTIDFSESNNVDKFKGYLNGTPLTNENTSNINSIPTGDFIIGARRSTSNYFNGKISELAVFDYALTSNAVTALYNSGIPANPLAVTTPPIAYYNLGQGSAYASGSAGIVEPNLAAATGSTVFDIPSKSVGTAKKYIETNINNLSDIDVTNKITVSTWVNFDDVTVNAYNPIINKGQIINSSNLGFAIARTRTPSGMVYAQVKNNSNTSITVPSTPTPGMVSSGKWANVVMRYDGAHVKIYVDGKLYESVAQTGNILDSSSTEPIVIGSDYYYNAGLGNNLVGKISNVQIWNTDLTDGGVSDGNTATGQIAELYNNGIPLQSYTDIPQSGSLKAWYKLGQSANWEADTSGAWQIPDSVSAYPQSFDFDGSTNQITLPSDFVAANEFSISIWLKPDDVSNNNFLGDGSSSSNFLRLSSTTQMRLKIGGNPALDFTESGGNNLIVSSWNHILIYRDSSNNVGIFVNGQTFSSTQSHSLTLTLSSIGRATNIFYEGQISNVALWNSDQSSEISNIYNSGVPSITYTNTPSAWYKLDNTATFSTNWSIPDASGNGNTGTSSGMTEKNLVFNNVSALNGESVGMDSTNLVPSNLIKSIPYSGYSMDFDYGSLSHINVGNISELNAATKFSISVWVNPDNITGTNKEIFTIANSTSQALVINHHINDLIYGVGPTNQFNRFNSALTAGIWAHLCFVFDGSQSSAADKFKLYKNGVYVTPSSSTQSSTVTPTFTGDAFIGAWALDQTDFTFNGKMSNFSIFNRALTQGEIIRIYNGGSPGNLSSLNPTSWWSLGVDSYFNGSNWICPDLIGSNNGTSSGMAAANLVGEGPGSLANGTSTNLDLGSDLVGNAPGSTGNAISVNMNFTARTGSTP